MNIYIALTPYHILLSLLHEDRQLNDQIIIIDQVGSLFEHYSCVDGAKYFDASWAYIEDYKISTVARALAFGPMGFDFLAPSISKMLSKLADSKFESIFVFNDTPVSVQYIMSKLNSNRVVYIEDGSAPYNNHQLHNSNVIKCVKRVLFGKFYDWKSVLGTSKYIQSGIFSSKEFIRHENKIYPSSDYVVSRNINAIMHELSQVLAITIDESASDRSALILLPCFSDTNSSVSLHKEFVDLISQLKDKGWEVYIKLHPLDWQNERINEFANCKVVKQHAPAEIIPCLLPSLSLVVGMRTTSLASIKFLYKERNIDIYSMSEAANDGNDRLYEYFSAVGVKVCSGCVEVMSDSKCNDKLRYK